MLWKDASGKFHPSLFERNVQMDNGLFEVRKEIIITQSSNQNLICVVRNTLLNKKKESTIHIASKFPTNAFSHFVHGAVILN